MEPNEAPTADDTQPQIGWTVEQAAQAFLAQDSEPSEPSDAPDATPDAPAATADDEPVDAETPEAPAEEVEAVDPDAEQEPAPEPPQPRKLRVKVDDAEEEVTEDELVKGYQRQSDYTRKTQQLAEQRKQFEAEAAAVRDERQKYAALLTELESALSGKRETPDWAKLRTELAPADFAAAYAQWDLEERNLAAVRAEKERVAQQTARDQAEQRAALLAAEQAKLLEAIPELRDPAKAKSRLDGLASYAKSYGWTEADISGITDHRLMLLLDKARAYDEMQKAKPKVQQKIEQKVKTATPGAAASVRPPVTEATRAKQRLAKTGSIRDAANVFLQQMPD